MENYYIVLIRIDSWINRRKFIQTSGTVVASTWALTGNVHAKEEKKYKHFKKKFNKEVEKQGEPSYHRLMSKVDGEMHQKDDGAMEKVPEADDYETMIVDEVTFGDGPTELVKYFDKTDNGIHSEFKEKKVQRGLRSVGSPGQNQKEKEEMEKRQRERQKRREGRGTTGSEREQRDRW